MKYWIPKHAAASPEHNTVMTSRAKGVLIAVSAFLLGVSLAYLASRRPGTPPEAALSQNERDAALVRSLLSENLKERRFSFATIAAAC